MACCWALALSVLDWRQRRLPNLLTLGGGACFLVYRLVFGGVPLLIDGFAAGIVAGLFLLVPFLLRGAGGGDVKMLFAAGIIVGWNALLPLLWYTSLAGVVLGSAMLTAGRLDGARLRHGLRSLFDWRYDRKVGANQLPPKESDAVRVPFSLAITAGMMVALVLR